MSLPTKEFLDSILRYDPTNGKLFWLERPSSMFNEPWRYTKDRSARIWNTRYAGKEAFTSLDGTGYRSGRILDKTYHAHRIIWVIVTGEVPEEVDHINGDRSDNRFSNLRAVTKPENTVNKCMSSKNTSGVTGVYWDKRRSKWTAAIQVRGKFLFLGYRETIEEASLLRKAAERRYGFHPNHGRAA